MGKGGGRGRKRGRKLDKQRRALMDRVPAVKPDPSKAKDGKEMRDV